MTKQASLLPHIMFSMLFHRYPAAFKTRVCVGVEQLKKFWSGTLGNLQLAGHPVLRIPGYESKVAPLSLRGDGVPVVGVGKTWSKSSTFCTWASMVGTGSTKD
eukprot:15027459-Alexandrium_andersonii.AAC.1